MESILYIREEGNKKRKEDEFFFLLSLSLGAVRDESLMHGFEWEKEVRNPRTEPPKIVETLRES